VQSRREEMRHSVFFVVVGSVLRATTALSTTTTTTTAPAAASKITFAKCGNCDAVYPLRREALGQPGSRVRCSVCGNVWFQAATRLNVLYDHFELKPYPKDRKPNTPSSSSSSSSGATLFVANLPFDCEARDLRDFFDDVAPGCQASVVRYDDGKSKGYGFVNVNSEEEARRAIDELDGADFQGRPLAVREGNRSGRRN